MKPSPKIAMMLAAAACVTCASDITGTLEIVAAEDLGSVEFKFTTELETLPAGTLFIGIKADGTELSVGQQSGTDICHALPPSGTVVGALPVDNSLECASITAAVFQYEAPEATTAAGTDTTEEDGPRCGIDKAIATAQWRNVTGCPVDASVDPPDAGFHDCGVVEAVRDGGVVVDAGEISDAGEADAGESDAGESDAATTDGGDDNDAG